MKYKVGDRVRVHSKEWFAEHYTKENSGYRNVNSCCPYINGDMLEFCSKVVTIREIVINYSDIYKIEEDDTWSWADWMFEGKVERVDERDIGDPNIIEHICKLLGIEVGQVIINKATGWKYRFSNKYFEVYNEQNDEWEVNSTYPFPYVLEAFATHQFTTKWTPEDGELVYYIDFSYGEGGEYFDSMLFDSSNSYHNQLLNCNMLYETRREAQEAAKRYMNQMKEGK